MARIRPMVGDKFDEQTVYVHLVWGITLEGKRCDLIAVCSCDASKDRYVETAVRRGRYHTVTYETVILDHLFGDSMLPNLLNVRV